jgi:hypothetical protein
MRRAPIAAEQWPVIHSYVVIPNEFPMSVRAALIWH